MVCGFSGFGGWLTPDRSGPDPHKMSGLPIIFIHPNALLLLPGFQKDSRNIYASSFLEFPVDVELVSFLWSSLWCCLVSIVQLFFLSFFFISSSSPASIYRRARTGDGSPVIRPAENATNLHTTKEWGPWKKRFAAAAASFYRVAL